MVDVLAWNPEIGDGDGHKAIEVATNVCVDLKKASKATNKGFENG